MKYHTFGTSQAQGQQLLAASLVDNVSMSEIVREALTEYFETRYQSPTATRQHFRELRTGTALPDDVVARIHSEVKRFARNHPRNDEAA